MDYKELLIKYIQHIGYAEGTDFIDEINKVRSGIKFTDEEWKELKHIQQELWPGAI